MTYVPTVSRSRGPFEKFTLEEKAWIGKRAAEHGVAFTASIAASIIIISGRQVKESTVRMWRNKNLAELKSINAKESENKVVEKLVDKK